MTDEVLHRAVDKMLLAAEADEGLAPLEIAEKYTEAVFDGRATRSASVRADASTRGRPSTSRR